MNARHALFLALWITIVPASTVSGQGAPRGTITGVVVAAADSSPIPFAAVRLDSSAAEVTADSAGSFAFRDVASGMHSVRAQRLGFAPRTIRTIVPVGMTTSVVLRLDMVAQTLAVVDVRGRKVLDLPRFVEAVERAIRNNGAVFTADDIQRENPLDTKSLLDQLPGVHTDDRGITFVRCQDSGSLPSSFGSRGSPKVQVYVDGMRLTRDGTPDDANAILKSINPRTIAVMEVYTGVAKIPAEYFADACAVIAIWTKAY